jgi:hypothetical protein
MHQRRDLHLLCAPVLLAAYLFHLITASLLGGKPDSV